MQSPTPPTASSAQLNFNDDKLVARSPLGRSFLLFAALAVGALVAWTQLRSRISADDVQAIEQALSRGARIVDVRTPAEFSGGHIDGALNIPLSALGGSLKRLGKKSTPVVVYCRSGSRSGSAAEILRRSGFTEVHDLKTMGNWQRVGEARQPRPTRAAAR